VSRSSVSDVAAFSGLEYAGATLLAALLAYGLAKLSWKFFEQPLLRRGHAYKFFPDPAFSSAHSERDPVLRPIV
jgi:peptidoglycan/LPS O-acetylase OafA/YrhL